MHFDARQESKVEFHIWCDRQIGRLLVEAHLWDRARRLGPQLSDLEKQDGQLCYREMK